MVGAAVVGVTSLSLAKANTVALSSIRSGNFALQAQQYADAEAAIIKATDYNDLSAKSKADIQNSNGFQREIIVSAESNYSDTIKQKIVSVNIYRSGESTPRVTLNVTRLNKELQPASGVPVGTIIAWPGSSAPMEGGTWLLCNGQSCTTYPALSAIVGSTVPNLNGRFLEGTTGSPRGFKDAGLPNIWGNIGNTYQLGQYSLYYSAPYSNGAFYLSGSGQPGTSREDGTSYQIHFNASRCSSIYGASATVQPASYTVRYYIKAA